MDVQTVVYASLLRSRSGRSHADRECRVTPAQAAARETRGALHLSELAGQFVNGMNHFEKTFYPSPSNFFKILRAFFIFHDFAAPSLQNDTFNLQTGWSGRPILANGKHSRFLLNSQC